MRCAYTNPFPIKTPMSSSTQVWLMMLVDTWGGKSEAIVFDRVDKREEELDDDVWKEGFTLLF